jgi:hypothetical protein
MLREPKSTHQKRRSFTAGRRALVRLRNGLDLQWTPPASRDALHDRGARKGGSESQSSRPEER